MRSTPSTMSTRNYISWDFSILMPYNTKKSRFIEIFSQKCVYEDGSNFFVFQNYGTSFSGFCYLFLKRSFPGSFEFWDGLELYISKITKNKPKKSKTKN